MPVSIVGSATTDVASPWAPAFPVGIAIGDILLIMAESVGGQNWATPSGWAHVGPNGSLSSPVVQGTNTQLTVFWRRYDGTGSAPTLTGPVDHGVTAMIAVRGCPATGNPWNVGATTSEATSDNTATFPGVTTTRANCLVLEILATSADVLTAQAGTLNNPAYGAIIERVDVATDVGNGGVLVCYSGVKSTAGATNQSTITLTSPGFKSLMTLAMAESVTIPPMRRRQRIPRRGRGRPATATFI